MIFYIISLYYDEKLKRWVDPNSDANEDDGLNNLPPPTDMQLMGASHAQKQPPIHPSGNVEKLLPPSGGNKFAAGIHIQY